jgi:hypothetical protein
VENFGRLYGSNQPISAHFTAFNSSDQLQRKRSSIFQEALIAAVGLLVEFTELNSRLMKAISRAVWRA